MSDAIERVKIALVGAGRMGHVHAQAYRGIPNAEVKVVCDVSVQAAREVADMVGASEVVDDWEAILGRKDIQAVDICTPEDAHADQIVAAAAAGKHVLVEKPVATTIADGERAVQAAEGAGILLMVGHCLRWDPRYNQAHQVVAAGGLGQLLSIYTRRSAPAAAQKRLKGRASLPMYLGVHDYDLLRWFSGAEVVRVVAESRVGFLQSQGYPTEDVNCALISLSNDALATCELGWVLPDGYYSPNDHRMDLVGTQGAINLAFRDSGLLVASGTSTRALDISLSPVVDGRVGGAFFGELTHFVDCVAAGRQPAVSGRDGLEAVRIALAVLESARTGRPVVLR